MTARNDADRDIEKRVAWKPFVAFDRAADPDNPKDRGNKPYEPGSSLRNRERRGSLVLEHADAWLGGILVHASDGKQTVDLMLDRAQVELLIEGARRWDVGIVNDWTNGDPDAMPVCPTCEGSGFSRS